MQFSVRVLGVHEDGQWCAIALDMSLRGYGESFREALSDLEEAIEAQLSFAMQHDTLDAIWKPAEPHYVELYQEVRRRALREYLEAPQGSDDFDEEDEYAVSDLLLPRSDRSPFEAVA